jgi:hypothetical protein
MTEKAATLPAEALNSLNTFISDRKSGSFVLDIKDGRILGWRTVENGRNERIPKYALR